MSSFEIVCEHCHSRYALPVELRERLRGSAVTCVVCMREWTPLPTDPRGFFGGAAAGQPPLALHHYLQSNPLGGPAAAGGVSGGTQPLAAAPAADRPSLRVVASGPGLALDAAFNLGGRSFLVGGLGCHIELPHGAGIPERAIRFRSVEHGFEFEGLGDFMIPIGPISVASGRIERGARLEVVLGPYRLAFEPSSQPGGPIRDLDEPPRPSAAAAPPVPAVAARSAAPVADLSQTVRGLGALGFDTRRFSNPLDELDVGLRGLDAPLVGETFWIKKSPTLVGRTAGDVVLADSRVSGKHAQIDILGLDQYSIKDLASTNGTTVNDRPASTARLKDGDVVGFGGVRFQFVARPKARRT